VSCGDNHGCHLDYTQYWTQYIANVEVDNPAQCPVLLQYSGQSEEFAADVTANSGTSYWTGVITEVNDATGNNIVGQGDAAWATNGDGVPESQPVVVYNAGNYVPTNDRDKVDVANMQTQPTDQGGAYITADADLSFRIGTAASVAGPGSVNGGTSASFTGAATNGASPYGYQWRVNNAVQSGQTGTSFSQVWSNIGTDTVWFRASDAHGVADSASSILSVIFWADIEGPAQLEQGTFGTWTVNIPAGTPPFTYDWLLDGLDMGGGTSVTGGWDDLGSHTVEMRAGDAAGHTTDNIFNVTVVTSGGCFQPPCQ